MNIAIIGGGNGGTTILGAFNIIEEFKVIGICDVNHDAPGMQLARQLGVPAFQDLGEIMRQPGLDLIIEATGSERVREQVAKLKPEAALMVDSQIANVMMTSMEGHQKVLNSARSKKEAFRTSAPFLTQTYGMDGVLYFTTNTECYDFVENNRLSIAGIRLGEPLVKGGIIARCISTRKEISETVDASVYGTRLQLWVLPIFEDDDKNKPVVGTYGVYKPKLHPVAKAFDIFAPIIIESQPEGAWVGVTDLKTIRYRMGSDKFDLKDVQVGSPLAERDTGAQSIRAKKKVQNDITTKKHGKIRMIGIPLFDEETGDLVGSFGIAVPRNLASDLQDMAARLNTSTGEMASVMQEIAASAGEINLTGEKLADHIKAVQENAASINQILSFTRNVADQTKMLGLNAAIEAARAGEHGRGFGVVAEEIRKLSDESKQTADQIGKQIREIELKVREAVVASETTLKQSEEQAAATQQVTASVMDLAQLADKLIELAQTL
ncbi:MAG: chemotaxis protein [Firmicutes bacterium HGW-Firmicutes-15]|nr:MAG: chemotaxis protein [Firmicutes bacterium HGW-Firmicutes-15]